jgi:tetratricopeptide (TPR) repeat protein
MSKSKLKSSLLSKYLKMYEKDPRSRVFAPLAEAYRKLGMLDESLKILRNGIKYNPSYKLGYIVLGNCYYDKSEYELCYSTIRPFIEDNRDNIVLQKLFANCCTKIGHLEESLDAYKFLLLINPKDDEVAFRVKELEDDLNNDIHESRNISTKSFTDEFEDEDDWVHVNFSSNKEEDKSVNQAKQIESDEDSHWVVVKTNQSPVKENEEKVKEITEIDNSENPILSLTLVDLYCSQKHFDKAIEVLRSFKELHPNDIQVKNKLTEVLRLKESTSELSDDFENSVEEDGHNKLLNLIERSVHKNIDFEDEQLKEKELENIPSHHDELIAKLNLFLAKIKTRSSIGHTNENINS